MAEIRQGESLREPGLPPAILAEMRSTDLPKGVVYADGRFASLAQPLLDSLGFDTVDDLRGLPFTSLWHHSEREMVADAMRRARAGQTATLTLDLRYLQDRDAECTVTLDPVQDTTLLVTTIDCPACDTPG